MRKHWQFIAAVEKALIYDVLHQTIVQRSIAQRTDFKHLANSCGRYRRLCWGTSSDQIILRTPAQ